MLAQSLLAEPAFYPSCAHRTHFLLALPHSHVPVMGYGGSAAPDWRNRKTCQPCTRRRQPLCQQVHAPPFCFFIGGVWGLRRTRLAEQKNLSVLHAPSAAILPASTCSPILFFHGGYGGSAAPEWRDRKTCQFCTRRRQPLCQQVHALPFCFFIGGMGAPPPCSRLALDLKRATFCPHVYPWPLTFALDLNPLTLSPTSPEP